ncbi:signal peptidase I [Marinigracilibium pacificum]|uniref:Signal peptidase I n=1 Tax=Marinigracilibium pacificum TaxID=2729599 RepID=A0A848J1Z0_9BACT|nr:signal peptidase I [Marinigracilibium pacificum]NMM50597.1 signal peptidase I [Marinigracilibium pacificum]
MSYTTFFIILAVLYILYKAGLYKLFELAGIEGWKALVPIYNLIILTDVAEKPFWWKILIFVPYINLIIWAALMIEFLRGFNKAQFIPMAFTLAVPFFYLPYLGFVEKPKWVITPKEARELKKKNRDWSESIVFAVFAVTVMKWGVLGAFTIPTSSMENTLLTGDYLFVSKLHYGVRTPETPLQVPLTHKRLGPAKSYSTLLQLPPIQIPGFKDVERNDIVVFNWPRDLDENGNLLPVDMKEYYVKRCVAVGGDIIEIKDSELFINGENAFDPNERQFEYKITTNANFNEKFLNKHSIREIGIMDGGYIARIPEHTAQTLEASPDISKVERITSNQGEGESSIWPSIKFQEWNKDWYGPLLIPAKGMKMEMTAENLAIYGNVIVDYEHLKDVEFNKEGLFIDGQKVNEYTFKQNYYFMMGDNRHNSLDSRYWGFVPEDHIMGYPLFIHWSKDPNYGLFSGYRFNRLGLIDHRE